MTETMKREDLLNWRPRVEDADEPVPRAVVDARLSLLSPEDRDVVNRAVYTGETSPRFLYFFCGGPDPAGGKGNPAPFTRDELRTAYLCANLTLDPQQALRIFEASGQYKGDGKPYLFAINEAMKDTIKHGRSPVTGKYEQVFVPSLGRMVDKQTTPPEEREAIYASLNRGRAGEGVAR